MQLRFVELFCDVAQLRSFSKGAAAHNVSQSSASQAVHLLEKRLGTLLIDRSKRPLELTPAGQVYFDGCRELLERYRAIEDQVQQLQDKVVGLVRVAAIYSVGLMQMESYIKRFEELYPEAQLRLEYLHPDQVYAQVLNDEADLGLVSFPRQGGEIAAIDWQNQPMLLVVPPGHRLAGRRSVSIRELADEDYVGFTRDLTIRREVDRWLKRARVSVNPVHEFDNIENIKRAIEVGSGIALLPGPTVRQEAAAGSLVAVPLNDVELFRPLGIVHRRQKQLTNAVAKLIELLQAVPADRRSTREAAPDEALPEETASAAIKNQDGHSGNGHSGNGRAGAGHKSRRAVASLAGNPASKIPAAQNPASRSTGVRKRSKKRV